MEGRVGVRGPGRACVVAGGLVLAALMISLGCSRYGALSGDVFVRSPSGDVTRAARISVFLVPTSEAFEREWFEAVAAFRQEVAPAAAAQKAAERQAQEARLAWDRALAVRGKAGASRGPWVLALRETGTTGSQQLWWNVRATEGIVFQARKRVWEIVQRHEEHAHALIEKHATQRVQTDENGHYVIVKVPAEAAYVYARWQEKKANAVWFVPIQIETGTQRADLTHDNQRSWPMVP